MNFEDKVIYQIYPRSFYDSNGDGIGDLPGIIQKIPYLKQLHIDMIWFNPFFVSPQNDNGYDIANYYAIDPLFGTMADFEELVKKLADNNIDVMLDMVLNHCSTEHEWFKKALAGEQHYQDFFYIRSPKADGSLPNNWVSKFGGPAWAPFGKTGKYYLHLYDKTQADLNWHNPAVRKEIFKIVNFWQNKGVKGFRFDVINVIGKSETLPDAPDNVNTKLMYTDQPIVHQYLQELNQATFGQNPNIITVGEMSSTNVANSVEYTNKKRRELSMVFTFHHLKVDYKNGQKWTKVPFDFLKLKKLLNEWQLGMSSGGGWNALFWNNHDQPWALSRFGDPVHFREKSAEMLATVIHLLRGTPYIYQGEELGMINPNYQKIDDYVDIETKNAYQELLHQGLSSHDALTIIQAKSRDNSRSPMHWDNSHNAGFTTGTPWLKPKNQDKINVTDELNHGEIFSYYQKLIHLRKEYPIIAYGNYQPIDLNHPQIYAYYRTYKGQILIVINNFYGNELLYQLPNSYQNQQAKVLISNYDRKLTQIPNHLTLKPYEAIALLIE
ncbi:alpha,alpha-phosphotrehalase [Lactobacillus sp. ESL0228]|uniref:alpha,alpha-phosphotrehalase n=1 Tax=Lactobacillus sp. ESL0228 TaxID=2069352 RepID=UPI000EFC2FCA|nr:alpha,alpha-phosphotrehalase [Lactobacillus sp. ESL0228]RMC52091.1 alpha,alpha-phosphotrehalase [Lactobacillus sp. ESL0228]